MQEREYLRHLDGVLEAYQRSLGVRLVEVPHLLVEGHQPAVADGDDAAGALEVEVVEPEAEEAAQRVRRGRRHARRLKVATQRRGDVGLAADTVHTMRPGVGVGVGVGVEQLQQLGRGERAGVARPRVGPLAAAQRLQARQHGWLDAL
eukprot:scaffold59027_cov54-Phaeocystis_antarctica.AAC.5